MALPQLISAQYNLTIPSTQIFIKFRPFTVREQKALLIAQQSANTTVMIDTLKGVIGSCVTTVPFDVNTLTTFDLEYVFIQIRSKSAGEIVELLFTCDECEHETRISFDLTQLNVEFPEGHNKIIKLTDDIGIVLKYPDVNLLKNIESLDLNDVDAVFDIVVECIDFIYDGDRMHYAHEQTKDELDTFVNSLNTKQFNQVQQFFETMPRLQQTIVFDCPKCKHHHDKVLSGLSSFF